LSALVAHRARARDEPGRQAQGGRALTRLQALALSLASVVMLAATGEIVIDGSVGHSPLIPKSPSIAGWMSGIGERLGYRVFLIALLCSCAAYLVLLLLSKRMPVRWAVALVVALHAILLVGPILISTDVFSYVAYARMGVVHGVNPYLHGPAAISLDPVYHYVGIDWRKVETAYGPLYTLISYTVGPLGVTGAVWGMKLEALLASAGSLWLTWRCAQLRGLDPRLALLALGTNPLYTIYAFGGAHNDLIMIFLTMAAVSLELGVRWRPRRCRRRAVEGAAPVERDERGEQGERVARGARHEALAGGAIVAATLVKATGVVPLPFIVLSRRRLAPMLGALCVAALGALAGLLAFGVHGIDVLAALNRDAAFVSTDSFPTEIAHLLGKPGVFPVDHDLLKGALVAIVLHLLWRTWRGYDWVAASGWTLLAISVTSTWLLAWYTLWPLPLALVSRDRRLFVAVLVVQALFVAHQISPLLAPVS
jgi:Glycosyltransferase family 87